MNGEGHKFGVYVRKHLVVRFDPITPRLSDLKVIKDNERNYHTEVKKNF